MEPLTSLESIFDPSAKPEDTGAPPPAEAAPPASTEPTPPAGDPPAPATETGELPADAPPAAANPAAPGTPPAPQDAPPASDDDEELPRDVKGLRAANKAERQKRKAMEERIAEMERNTRAIEQRAAQTDTQARALAAYLEGLRQGQPQPSQQPAGDQLPPEPDPETDPRGAIQWTRNLMGRALKAQQERFEAALAERDVRNARESYDQKVLTGDRIMRAQYQDYDAMVALAAQVAEGNEQLRVAILNAPEPTVFAYEQGRRIKTHRDVQAAGGWENYQRAVVAAQVEAEVARRLAVHQPSPPPAGGKPATPPATHGRTPPAPPPQSLAGVTSTAPRAAPQWQGPTPLEQLFKS